jgi:threonyl-tRNA synthetase
MKTLNLHVDYIEWESLKKAFKKVDELGEQDISKKKIEEALVILIAVEKNDNTSNQLVGEFIENTKSITEQIKTKNIVIYPYAHLSRDLGNPKDAMKILDVLEERLKKEKFEVSRAPFGYYKSFELKVKGHPLSELSREIKVQGNETEETFDSKQLLREISKSKLDTSKLKENDHRIIGKQMDLFSFNEVAPGMIFWHNNGLTIYNELINFMRELMKHRGYEEIKTPQIMDKKLWQISGHWDKYKENNFSTEYEGRQFLIKPMNCPGGLLVYKNTPKSYKDLPLKSGEFGIVHRQELSGVLGGLFRVIQFTQDDAHVFCTEKQLEEETSKLMDLIDVIYCKFGFKYSIELSTRPEKRIGDDKIWDKAEKALENVLKKRKAKFKINKGDGAFYGPKIDFHLDDSLGRTWQCGTIQADFSMPERFELEYTDKDNQKKRPIMLHRAIYGSLERFIGILIEHLNGRFPSWLAPIQVRILSFTDRNEEYGKEVIKKLREAIPNLRIDADFTQRTIQAKVKDAEMMKIPYILTVGDKEQEIDSVNVRKGGQRNLEVKKVDEFIDKLASEIKERK